MTKKFWAFGALTLSMALLTSAAQAGPDFDVNGVTAIRDLPAVARYKMVQAIEPVLTAAAGRPSHIVMMEITPLTDSGFLVCGKHVVGGTTMLFTMTSDDINSIQPRATRADLDKAGCGSAYSTIIWEP